MVGPEGEVPDDSHLPTFLAGSTLIEPSGSDHERQGSALEVTVTENSRRNRTITFTIEATRFSRWYEASQRLKMSLDEWITLSIEMADHLSLLEGAGRLPEYGTKMDPILAAAIMKAAEGQPWEHKAVLLVGSPGFRVNPHTPVPTATRRSWTRQHVYPNEAVVFFAKHGLALTSHRFQPARVGSETIRWGELAVLLLYWERSDPEYATLDRKYVCRITGLKYSNVQDCTLNLQDRGWLLGKGDRKRGDFTFRIEPSVRAMLEAGDFSLG